MDERTIARFWSKVDRRGPDDCWEWKTSRHSFGYGLFHLSGPRRTANAHRVSWAIAFGDAGPLFVLHKCDNPPCCNPAHLFLGTQRANIHDMMRKRRFPLGESRYNSKFDAGDIKTMRILHSLGARQRDIAQWYGACLATVSQIVLRKRWKHI